jgi:hypothetical protein
MEQENKLQECDQHTNKTCVNEWLFVVPNVRIGGQKYGIDQ